MRPPAMLRWATVALALAALLAAAPAAAFYLPGVAPNDFQKKDQLLVKVNKLTSTKTQLPYSYYSLPFCKPNTIVDSAENLGEVLRGDRIENSPYVFEMREPKMCQIVCKASIDEKQAKELKEKIEDEYRVNMILDNLPLVVPIARQDRDATVYQGGYHVGVKGQYAGSKDEKVFIHNHLTFFASTSPLAVMSKPVHVTPATKVYDLTYYTKAALAGGICCSITHGAMCPVDVVKTRIQLDPVTYNKGMVGTFNQIVKTEGAAALASGLGATAVGYFVQGWFKFGGVEFFKIKFATAAGPQKAWDNRTSIYLASSAMAEFVADLFLCPLEAVRIRSVSDPTFPKGLGAGAAKMLKTDGFLGFYAGLAPILFKQVPYTMAKFAVQGLAAESMYKTLAITPETSSKGTNLGISLGSGVIAGVAAAIISHPADTLLSKVNKAGAGGTGSIASRLINIAKEMGFVKLATTGLAARCVMIGTLTAGQFGIFDTVMGLVGASKFHFHDPKDDKH